MTVSEKVAYLKGLMEGMGIDADSKNGKLFHAVSDILEELAGDVLALKESSLELAENIDALTDDLADVEDLVYGEDEEDEEKERAAPGCGYCCGGSENGEDGEEPVFFDVKCQFCGKTITVDEDIFDLGTVQCPNCGEMMVFGEEVDEPEEDGTQPADG